MYVHCIVSESDIWNSYVLTHTKEPIAEPLTTLPTKELEAEALKLFKVRTALHKLFALENIKEIGARKLSTN